MNGSKEDLIRYRIERSLDTFDDAIILANKKKWNSVINRLYYKAYYAVMALLLNNDLMPTTHNGSKSNFSEYYIKTGKIDRKYGIIYSQLFNWRQKGDYDDFFDFSDEIVFPILNRLKSLLKKSKKFWKKTRMLNNAQTTLKKYLKKMSLIKIVREKL